MRKWPDQDSGIFVAAETHLNLSCAITFLDFRIQRRNHAEQWSSFAIRNRSIFEGLTDAIGFATVRTLIKTG
ncbi:hypothetical protein [Brevundimonas sp. FT23028]|uniref:hypothetical protein n=1 Tax=Brevundimonas sp. FT23028 TaxID=3393748 RepID=UPI003B587348